MVAARAVIVVAFAGKQPSVTAQGSSQVTIMKQESNGHSGRVPEIYGDCRPGSVFVSLSREMQMLAAEVGIYRNVDAMQKRRSHPDGFSSRRNEWSTNIEGAAAELAVAYHFGMKWVAIARNLARLPGDVGDIQVKQTDVPAGHLQLNKGYADDRTDKSRFRPESPYIGVRGVMPKMELFGWLYGWEIVRPEWVVVFDTDKTRPVYRVPTQELRHVNTIPLRFRDAKTYHPEDVAVSREVYERASKMRIVPNEPGFWWYRTDRGNRVPRVHEVIRKAGSGKLCVLFDDVYHVEFDRPVEEYDGQWYGPIPMPESWETEDSIEPQEGIRFLGRNARVLGDTDP